MNKILMSGLYTTGVNSDILNDENRIRLSNISGGEELFLGNIMTKEIYKSKVIKVLIYRSNNNFIEKGLSKMIDI